MKGFVFSISEKYTHRCMDNDKLVPSILVRNKLLQDAWNIINK